ncbi:MAG TPA: 16S rRNA (uracil(1498)-N(3))-methyltransferase [Geobacteraceae bacterium]|nr:16S rRNA (uracil(1498)-N(3))-methyltransferase [Geobacteraceae bacterium]
MRRFFVPPEFIADGRAVITGDLFRHMAKVVRLKSGDHVLLADGTGNEFSGVVREVERERLVVTLEERSAVKRTPVGPAISIYQGLPKGDKLDLILQKTTELGVAEIIPFPAARSVPRIRKGEETDKVARWQRIAREAARQSGRAAAPTVRLAGGMAEIVRDARQSLKLILWEEEELNGLRETLARSETPESIAVIVGPEGGLTAEEAALAKESGFIPVSLGRRILRTETAGLAVIAILQFIWGDVG